eukprot:Seg3223.1 transcript_id=Seg3223.1/GoldUCD/mRNA.D3Y31 product="hypothetical protein" protein_id=Seg3223.1/GoldUCD/D3Y31
MEWSRAVWQEGKRDEEGTVPSSWIKGEMLFWPTGVNALRAMSEGHSPNAKWKQFPLVKIKMKSGDRKLCEDYDFTTAAEMSDDDRDADADATAGKVDSTKIVKRSDPMKDRCRTPTPPPRSELQPTKRKHSHQSSTPQSYDVACSRKRSESNRAASHRGSASSSVSKSYRGRSPQRTSKKFRSRSPSLAETFITQRSRSRSSDSQRSTCEGNPYDVSRRLSANQRNHKSKSASSANSSSISTSSMSISEENDYDSFQKGLTEQRICKLKTPSRTSGKAANDIFPMPEGKFQRRVLYLLTEIRDSLKQREAHDSQSEFTIHTIEDQGTFEDLERDLMDSDAKKQMVSRISRIGGASLRDNVTNVMHRLLTNKMMSCMNMKGNKGKTAFSKTKVYEVVVESVMQSSKNCSESQIAEIVAKISKHAPARKGGSKNDAE